jgi:cytochrome c peroxidase
MKKLVFIVPILVLAFACKKDHEQILSNPGDVKLILPDEPYNYADYEIPGHFDSPLLNFFQFIPASNPTTDNGATLGRVLFYDVNLSKNRNTSCSSCHQQEFGFSDPNILSIGHSGGTTGRHSMHLVNMQFNSRVFWDRRANLLETQVLMPIQDPVEMGMTLDDVVARLNTTEHYPPLFEKAFGDQEITADRISKALAQFVRSIISFTTKYDKGFENNFADFTPSEAAGMELFFSGDIRCNHCHSSQNLFSRNAMNNGLDSEFSDLGYYNVTGDTADIGRFKVPSLRNVAVTAPYMHDARFSTLEEVIEHYDTGVQPSATLDDRITVEIQPGGTPLALNLTDQQKLDLIAFLHTLTEESILTHPKYSNPFVVVP